MNTGYNRYDKVGGMLVKRTFQEDFIDELTKIRKALEKLAGIESELENSLED